MWQVAQRVYGAVRERGRGEGGSVSTGQLHTFSLVCLFQRKRAESDKGRQKNSKIERVILHLQLGCPTAIHVASTCITSMSRIKLRPPVCSSAPVDSAKLVNDYDFPLGFPPQSLLSEGERRP